MLRAFHGNLFEMSVVISVVYYQSYRYLLNAAPAKTLAQINVTNQEGNTAIGCHETASSAPPLQVMTMLLVVHPGAAACEGVPMGAAEYLI